MNKIMLLFFLTFLLFDCKKNNIPSGPTNPDDTTNSHWTRLSYLYQDATEFMSVYFADASTGYAAGYCRKWMSWSEFTDYQLIMKTENAGASWDPLTLPGSTVSSALRTVYFTDENTGFAAGSSILKTSDGGAYWTVLPTDISCFINSLFFIDTNTGYAAGASTHDDVTSGVILRTTDSGTSWSILTLSDTTATSFNSVYFTDASTGYAVGIRENLMPGPGIVFKTTDGGNNWQSYTLPESTATDLNSVYFIDANTGFAAGRFIYSNPDLDPDGVIMKTLDGGNTWTKLTLPKTRINNLNSIFFSDAVTGYAAGYYYDNGLFRGVIIKTKDAGETWFSLTLPGGDVNGQKLNSIFFLDNNTGYAAGENGIFLKTTSGGE